MKLRTAILLIVVAIVITIAVTMNVVGAVSIGEFQQSQDVQIYQTCNNCTSCNFTRVMKLNNQTFLRNLTATKDGTYYYYDIDAGNFSDKGNYKYCYECGNNVEQETGCIDFEITYTGKGLDDATTKVYILAMGFLLFILIITILFINKLPSDDNRDEEGLLLSINSLKHLRKPLWMFCWFLILGMLFIMASISLAYLPTTLIGKLFFNIYTILFWVSIVAIPVIFGWTLYKLFRDNETKKMLERGVQMGGSL